MRHEINIKKPIARSAMADGSGTSVKVNGVGCPRTWTTTLLWKSNSVCWKPAIAANAGDSGRSVFVNIVPLSSTSKNRKKRKLRPNNCLLKVWLGLTS